MASYKKIFAYSSLGCVLSGVILGAGLTYFNANLFDKFLQRTATQFSNAQYEVSYESEKTSFFKKTGRLVFKSKNQQLTPLAIPFSAQFNMIDCKGDFFIPQNELFKDNLNKFGIEKIKFDFGLLNSELMFDVRKSNEPVFYSMDGVTFLTDAYTGMVEIKNDSNIKIDDLILTLGAKNAAVKFAYSSWQDTSLSLEGVTYSAPIELFFRAKGDYHAPKYSHLKVNHLDVVKSVVNKDNSTSLKVAQSFSDVQLYRRMQKNHLEANGLKFDVGNKLGSVVIEGTNTPVMKSNFDLIDLEGKYKIKFTGMAFKEESNPLIREMVGIKALQKENLAYVSDAEIKKGEAFFNSINSDVVINKLIQMNFLNPAGQKTAAAGATRKAPEIDIKESK